MNQVREWTKIMNELYKRPENRANVNLCIIGLRNLIHATNNCGLTCSLTDHIGKKNEASHNLIKGTLNLDNEKESEHITTEVNAKKKPDKNPNFLKRISLKNIYLSHEPMLWPMLRIDIKEASSESTLQKVKGLLPTFLGGEKGSESCYTIVPLINFIPK